MIRFPDRSLLNRMSGGTAVVALYSVIIAGPEYFLPIGIESREKIAAASLFSEKNTGARSRDTLPGRARPVRARAC